MHHDIQCYDCNQDPDKEAKKYEIAVLSKRLKLRSNDLEDRFGYYPRKIDYEWEGFWNGLSEESRDLFVQAEKLKAEVEWLEGDVIPRIDLGDVWSGSQWRAIHW